MATIQFFFPSKKINLRSRSELKLFIQTIFKKEGKKLGQLTYVFCSDEFLLDINRIHLQHDYYTDIITFDLSEGTDYINGEIYVSADRVKDNATRLGIPISHELHRVIFHGLLHLCGYKDKTKEQVKVMRAKEDFYLNLYFK